MTDHTLAIIIMADPRRRARAELLAEYVGADEIVWDGRGDGEWITGARAWLRGSELGATHTLVLQDDAIPVEGFREQVMARIDAEPSSPLSLYLGRKKPTRWARNVADAVEEAEAYGACWISSTHLLHGVALVLPSGWIVPMLAASTLGRDERPYDQRIGAYLRLLRHPVLYTWPSLVDHDDSAPSLVEHVDDARTSTDGRVAYRVGVVDKVVATVVMIDTPEGAEL